MSLTKYVDTIIGTVGDEQDTSFHGGGKTHPGACRPFGMVQLSPDTTTSGDNGSGYNYCQNTIEGFSFNHMSGVGWYGDLGNLQIMPTLTPTDLRSGTNAEVPFTKGRIGWRSEFSHDTEKAEAGYYSVMLDRYGIFCEATVTDRTGILRFTYPEGKKSAMILNFARRIAGRSSAQSVEVNGQTVTGKIECDHSCGGFGRGAGRVDYTLYFALEISKEVKRARFFENEEYLKDDVTHAEGEDLHLLVEFDTDDREEILVKCGISYASIENAKCNLEAECPDFDFDNIKNKADSAWEEALSRIKTEGGNETDKTLFYTCLYHTMLDPRIHNDVNAHTDHTRRTVFSGWDVYRSEFPLLTLISPETVNDEINTLLSIALEKNSSFPRWELMGCDSGCMTGDPGTIVLADAYLKGIRNFDVEKAYEIAVASAKSKTELFSKPFKNLHPTTEQYKNKAYISGELSRALEFLMANYALANLAKRLGREEDYAFLSERVNTYKDNFNKETGFMGARDENGGFLPAKDEYDTKGCLESNIFQQSWFVPYDIEGLAELLGKERAIDLLEKLFDKADLKALWNENYNHSNEPCHNLTHYFAALGKPERTQYWTRRVQKEAYRKGAYGFCGNEDVGQLSAWYVLSALGLVQICMSDDKFYLNTPLFRRAVLTLDKKYHTRSISDTFTVECDKDPLEYPYIDTATVNGTPLNHPYVTYGEITNGGTLKLSLKQ